MLLLICASTPYKFGFSLQNEHMSHFAGFAIVRSGARARPFRPMRASVLSHAHVQSDARARMSSSYPPQMNPETVFRFAQICSLVANAKSRAYYSFSRSQVQTSLPHRGDRIRRLVPNCWAREQHLLLLEEPTEMSCGEGGCRRLGCDVFICYDSHAIFYSYIACTELR